MLHYLKGIFGLTNNHITKITTKINIKEIVKLQRTPPTQKVLSSNIINY